MDQSNQMTGPLLFDVAFDFAEGVAMVRMGDRLGFIDHTGGLAIPVVDPNIGVVSAFSEDRAVARAGDYYGYIDRTGALAIAVQFKQAKSFSDGLAAVRGDTQYGYINRQGEWMIAPPIRFS